MLKKKNIFNIIKFIIIIIIFILIAVFSLSYTINKNNNYKSNMIKKINNNYSLNDTITYINYYNDYYIITTKDKVVVLNNEYKEVAKEEINKIANNKNNYEIIYKNNKLMYENTIRKEKSITYEYYDIKTYEKKSSISLED